MIEPCAADQTPPTRSCDRCRWFAWTRTPAPQGLRPKIGNASAQHGQSRRCRGGRVVVPSNSMFDEGSGMQTYLILRRTGWRTAEDLQEAAARSTAEGDLMPDDIRWIRSYVLAEQDGSVGTVCIYQASSPEVIRDHAKRADLPVDEIVEVPDTVVVRADPQPATV